MHVAKLLHAPNRLAAAQHDSVGCTPNFIHFIGHGAVFLNKKCFKGDRYWRERRYK